MATLLIGCESIKVRNLGKSGVATTIAYVTGGTIPAIAVLGSSMAYDEVIPTEPQIKDIKTKEQAVAHVADSFFMNALYGFIAFLLITNILTPWLASKKGYNQAKAKYRSRKDD